MYFQSEWKDLSLSYKRLSHSTDFIWKIDLNWFNPINLRIIQTGNIEDTCIRITAIDLSGMLSFDSQFLSNLIEGGTLGWFEFHTLAMNYIKIDSYKNFLTVMELIKCYDRTFNDRKVLTSWFEPILEDRTQKRVSMISMIICSLLFCWLFGGDPNLHVLIIRID